MKTTPTNIPSRARDFVRRLAPRFLLGAHLVAIAVCVLGAPPTAHAQSTGTITGRVTNAATGEYLKFAIVRVVGTDRTATADVGGVFAIPDVPAGDVKLAVSYTGLDTAEAQVTVAPGQTVARDFNLTGKGYGESETVKLGQFVVTTEREGQARAIMDQRNAINAKSVMAADVFGQVTEGNVAEFLKYMPGVAIEYSESDARMIRIRGFDAQYTALQMDGNPVANTFSSNLMDARSRAPEFETMSINNVESIEVTKVPLPNVDGASGAGVINVRSKRAFDRQGRSLNWSYSLTTNTRFPVTFSKVPNWGNEPRRPFGKNWQIEYADVFLDKRLGIVLGYNVSNTLVTSERISSSFAWDNNPDNNDTEIPRMNNTEFKDAPKPTERTSATVNIDYKLTPNAYIGFRWNLSEFDASIYDRLLALNNTAANLTQPYTLNSQTFNASNDTYMRLRGGAFNKISDLVNMSIPFGYKRGDFQFDGSLAQSISRNWYRQLDAGMADGYEIYLRNITYRVEMPNSSEPYWAFTQLTGPGGAPVSETTRWDRLANYPMSGWQGLNNSPRHSKDTIWSANGDAKLARSQWRIPTIFHGGFAVRTNVSNQERFSYPLTYNGTAHLTTLGNFVEDKNPLDTLQWSNVQPQFHNRFALGAFINANPQLFTVNEPQAVQNYWTNVKDFKEEVQAGYFYPTLKFGKLDLIPGARYERTRVYGKGNRDIGDRDTRVVLGLPALPAGQSSPAAVVNTVDYRHARYGNIIDSTAKYDHLLKHLHARYRLRPNAMLQFSYRESLQRPGRNNAITGITGINPESTPLPSVTVNNPDLKPETGQTFNLGGNYYYEPSGVIGVFFFRQNFKNKVTRIQEVAGPEGVLGETEYAGWQVNTPVNVPNPSHMTGVELEWRQQFSSLPKPFNGLGAFANVTFLKPDNWRNFTNTKTRTGAGGVSYRYRRLFTQVNFTWQDEFLNGYNLAQDVRTYTRDRLQFDLNLTYELPWWKMQLFVHGRNIFDNPERQYQVRKEILRYYGNYGAQWTAGIKGRF